MRRARPHRYRHSARRVDAGGCDPSRPRRGCFAFGSLAPSARRDVVRVSDRPTSAPRSAASRRVTTPPGSILRHAGRTRTVADSTVYLGHWRQSGNPDAAIPRRPHGDGSGRTRPSALRSRPISPFPGSRIMPGNRNPKRIMRSDTRHRCHTDSGTRKADPSPGRGSRGEAEAGLSRPASSGRRSRAARKNGHVSSRSPPPFGARPTRTHGSKSQSSNPGSSRPTPSADKA